MNSKLIIGFVIGIVVLLGGGVLVMSRKPSKSDLVLPTSHQTNTKSTAVTLVEFGDYQCPACATYHPVLQQVLNTFAGKINFVFRNFPLTGHKNARLAAQAAEAAALQGAFWPMYDKLYVEQAAWSDLAKPMDLFAVYAKDLNLNVDQFILDAASAGVISRINQDVSDGINLGVQSTPTFFLNGTKLQNPGSLEDFETLIKAALLQAPLTQQPTESYHAHIDLKVYRLGKQIDFSQAKETSETTHVHDHNGSILHFHAKETSLSDFFKSQGFDVGGLKLIVNGKMVDNFESYIPQDMDRVLLSDNPSQQEIASVADMACIYSLKCPERGEPPTEKCVGALGTDCE